MLFSSRLTAFRRQLCRGLSPEFAIPGTRPEQVALLRETGLFDKVRLEEHTDLVIEIAALLAPVGAVAGASQLPLGRLSEPALSLPEGGA